MDYGLKTVPAVVLDADAERFDSWTVGTAIQYSGRVLDYELVGRYCRWFVGGDYGWKECRGETYTQGYRRGWIEGLGLHLAGGYLDGMRRFSLHMCCKAGRVQGRPYYWTRYVALDIDRRPGQSNASLADRFAACRNALGCDPVVIRSPRHGLHLYFPLERPMSVLGLTDTLHSRPPVVQATLTAHGVSVRPGWVEVMPARNHTLRLPLAPGTVQLDPATLSPLTPAAREAEIARFIQHMEQAARATPLDPHALAGRPASSRRPKATERSPQRAAGGPALAGSHPDSARPDIRRLEEEGLYLGVGRNAGAMALARSKMLGQGWGEDETVEFLMRWTATKSNGLSASAARMSSEAVARRLRDEYCRICGGISRALRSGLVVVRRAKGVGQPLSDIEAHRVFQLAGSVQDPYERYRMEVFLFCITGFAKDCGTPAVGPARHHAGTLVRAQVSSKMMERWPYCGSGKYRVRLRWAEELDFTRLVLNYRHSCEPKRSRSKTFEFDVDLESGSTLCPEPSALLKASEFDVRSGGPNGHARQVEHALQAIRTFGPDVLSRYGPTATQRMVALQGAYAGAAAHRAPEFVMLDAA